MTIRGHEAPRCSMSALRMKCHDIVHVAMKPMVDEDHLFSEHYVFSCLRETHQPSMLPLPSTGDQISVSRSCDQLILMKAIFVSRHFTSCCHPKLSSLSLKRLTLSRVAALTAPRWSQDRFPSSCKFSNPKQFEQSVVDAAVMCIP